MSNARIEPNNMLFHWGSLVLFVLVVMGLGGFVGASTPPGEWYANLAKPFFNPPNWLFAPVWTVLYAMVAIAGWRAWTRGETRFPAQVWTAQFIINLTWSPAFFVLQNMGLALAIIAVMIALTVVFIRSTWNADRTTSLLMVPYLAWISFASVLNATLWAMN